MHCKEDFDFVIVSRILEFNQNLDEMSGEVGQSLTELVAGFYCLKNKALYK